VLRALFNYLNIARRAGNDLPSPVRRPRGMTEYLDSDGSRLALTNLAKGRAEQDPRWLLIDQQPWRTYRDAEGHRCNMCELARDRDIVPS